MNSPTPIAVTGMGAVSAIGENVAAHLDSLSRCEHGIRPISNMDTYHRGRLLAGEIMVPDDELYRRLGISPGEAYTRSTLLGGLAAREAIVQAGIDLHDGHRTGFISATTVGGMDATERHYDNYVSSPAYRHFIPTHPGGVAAEQLAALLGVPGMVTTISTACSSAANAIMLGARMIRAGVLDRAIVGGTDCLSRFTINGFNALMIYADDHCRPFDEHRKGLNLGEAAAYLVLEAAERKVALMRAPLAYLTGYGNANDAFHQTASSEHGEGAYLAMEQALHVAGVAPAEVGYINAHGTATPNNDLAEGHALLRLFGRKDDLPPFSSTKAFTGHTLAAAGAVEAVFSVLALQHQLAFANLNFSEPIAGLDIVPLTQPENRKIDHVLSNSFGFGGNCTALLFSKAHD